MKKLDEILSKTVIDEHLAAGYKITVCPVCSNETLDDYFICPTCGWEYDAFPEDHYSAANGATLREYRERYQKSTEK